MITIDIPPLKQRPEDVLPLAQHFISQEMEGREVPVMDNAVLSILQNYVWPGNVRELQNVIQHCLTFMKDGQITKETLPSKLIVSYEENPDAKISADPSGEFEKGKSLKAFLRTKEKEYLKNVISTMGGDKVKAAQELDISLATLYRKLPEEKQETE